jgi:hypothetical protein
MLRWHLENLLNNRGGVAQCFLDAKLTRDLVNLSKSIPTLAQGGAYHVIDGCQAEKLDYLKCMEIDTIVEQILENPFPQQSTTLNACETFYADRVYVNFIEELQARDQKVAAAEAEKQRRLESQRRVLEAKKSAEARADQERSQIFSATGVPTKYQVTWGPNLGSSTGLDTNLVDALNRVNKDFLASMEVPQDLATFTPPPKGKFEKSLDYDKRVSVLQDEHRQRLSSTVASLSDGRSKLFAGAWARHMGAPRIDKMSYDADGEVFTANIRSATGYSIPISIPVPIAEAPARDAKLIKMRPWVLFYLDDDRLIPRAAVLQEGSDVQVVQLVGVEPVPFEFNESALDRYNELLESRRLQDEERKRQAQAAKAKQYPYIVLVECTVNGMSTPMSACLRTDGEIRIQTAGRLAVYRLPDFTTSSSHTDDLTESFQVGVQVGTGSRFGTLSITITDRASYKIVGSQVASGAGDFAMIAN